MADGDLAVLALLDLSSAFDTIDHDILLRRRNLSFRRVVQYLVGCSHTWTAGLNLSVVGPTDQKPPICNVGFRRGRLSNRSCFCVYGGSDSYHHIIESTSLSQHASETQICSSCRPSSSCLPQYHLSACVYQQNLCLDAVKTAPTECCRGTRRLFINISCRQIQLRLAMIF